MREFFAVITNHPWATFWLAVFICLLTESLTAGVAQIVREWRRK